MNPTTGARTLLSDFGVLAPGPRGEDPIGVAIEASGTILVSDFSAGTGDRGVLFRVNATNGTRTILQNFGASSQGPLGFDPIGVAVETAGTILVIDVSAGTSSRGALFRVNPSTGTRTLLSNLGSNAQGPLGMNPYGVAIR